MANKDCNENETPTGCGAKPLRKLNCNLCEDKFQSTVHLGGHMKTHPEVLCFVLQLSDIESFDGETVADVSFETELPKQEISDGCVNSTESVEVDPPSKLDLTTSSEKANDLKSEQDTDAAAVVAPSSRRSPRKRRSAAARAGSRDCGSQVPTGSSSSTKENVEKNRLFVCSYCEKTFSSLHGHHLHEKSHTGDFAFTCEICGKGFHMYSPLQQHLNSHNNVKPFSCAKCDKSFASNQKRKVHEEKCGEPPPVPQYLQAPQEQSCAHCDKKFQRKESLKLHVIIQHTKDGKTRFKCDLCSRHFSRKGALQIHQKNPRACRSSLLAGSASKILEADVQDSAVLELSQKPQNSTVADDKKPFKCDVCDKACTTTYGLEMHKRKHTDNYPFRCEECGKGFNSNNTLNGHLNRHKDLKPHACVKCGKAFYHITNMQRHFRYCNPSKQEKVQQKKEENHICAFCGKLLQTAGGLQLHMNKHTGKFPFHCKLCDKGYNSNMLLNAHIDSHLNVKGYMCQHCGKGFRHKSNLNRHVSYCDPGNQPADGGGGFACDQCGKTFKRKESLPEHKMAKHSSVKFQCTVCDKEYDSRGSLFWHRTKSACARGGQPAEPRRKAKKKETAPEEPQLQLLQPVASDFQPSAQGSVLPPLPSVFDLNQSEQQLFVFPSEGNVLPTDTVVQASSMTMLEALGSPQVLDTDGTNLAPLVAYPNCPASEKDGQTRKDMEQHTAVPFF